ncbi:MAG: DUF1109 domain-containing protein [Sulfuritalea sp.]|nr:DUF1109 domain-containing protein [Sulfuritalea sp.]
MKTNDLIVMLATGASVERAGDPWRRLVHFMGFGTLVSTILMAKAIPVNPDLATVIQLASFWQKLGFAAAIAAVALLMVFRLSRPGVRLGNAFPALMAPILAIWILAGIAFATAEPGERAALFFGNTWKVCPFLIAMLATPVFAASFWAMRDLAPTNLRLAGAAAGLFSGAVGAVVYCFHCPELEVPFIAFWYLLGILIPTAAGTVLGENLLRW